MDKSKAWFWILLEGLIAVAIINVIFFVMPLLASIKNSYPPARTISVTAQGKTTASPDIAQISFSVLTTGTNPQTLSTNNTDKMNAVLEFVSSQGIAPADMKTTAYDLQPNYQYDQSTNRQYITGYTLTQTVTIKVRDLPKVAPILGGLTPLGVNQIGGINFTFDNPEKFLGEARADAFAKAKAKATEMASQAGVGLGEVLSFSESGTTPPPRPYYDFASNGGGGISKATAPSIQPGSQDVTDDVTIVYALR